jgi:hypothetical protein
MFAGRKLSIWIATAWQNAENRAVHHLILKRKENMKSAKLLKRLSNICFLVMWIPFAMVMINGPLRLATGGPVDLQSVESVFTGIWMIALGALFAGTFIFFIASLLVGALANQRILATGQDGEATILSIADTGTRINDDPVIDFSLQVRSAGCPAFAALARQTVSMIHLPAYQPGRIVSVKFVPGTDHVAIVGPKM